MSEPIHIISLGAGVQSSTMALMAAAGEITPMPKAAIFADTQAEPRSVYIWLDWLVGKLPFPVVRVSKGNLTTDTLRIRNKKDGTGTWAKSNVPVFIRNEDGTRGIIQRQCTYDYKVMQLIKASVKLMHETGADGVVQWIGISRDEAAYRMKPSRDSRIKHRWPLVDLEMTRHDCLRWMETQGHPRPPRSACIYCPYHNDNEWRRLRDDEPEEFARAVQFERDLQRVKKLTNNIRGVPFLHDSLVPLDEVNFQTDIERGQKTLWENDCEGLCGV